MCWGAGIEGVLGECQLLLPGHALTWHTLSGNSHSTTKRGESGPPGPGWWLQDSLEKKYFDFLSYTYYTRDLWAGVHTSQKRHSKTQGVSYFSDKHLFSGYLQKKRWPLPYVERRKEGDGRHRELIRSHRTPCSRSQVWGGNRCFFGKWYTYFKSTINNARFMVNKIIKNR